MRGLTPRVAMAAAALLASGCARAESGISFLGDPEVIAFAIDRGEGWETVAVHEGPFDSSTYDYPLEPGETVQVVAGAGDTAVELAVTAEDDIAYAVVATVGVEDPTAMCMGCGAPVSEPLDPDDPDGERLWLYETFNGISSPIMF